LIKIESGKDRILSDSLASAGAKIVENLGNPNWRRIKLADGITVEESIKEFSSLPGVIVVQPNFYYHLLLTPNDPQFTSSGMYGLTKISAPQAWDLTTGSSSVVVADIDTGMRYTHQDLAPNAWINPGEIAANGVDDDSNGFIDDVYGWDFFYNDSNPIDDAGGHGTHTAGTIGAAGNNLLNVVGVNWNVKIMPIKIYSPNGADSTSAMLVNAYSYIRMMKLRGVNIRVTNNSYGDCGEACGYDQATKDALDAMGDAGILNVFAAGNSAVNNDITPAHSYPSVYTSPSIIAVASSTNTDARSSFSCWGPTSVDLAAPGSSVLSTYNTSDSATATLSGTSMATPHVTGAAALLSAYNPSLSVASLKATLMNTVDVLPAWTGLVKSNGRLNIFAALQNQTVCNFNLSNTSISARTKGGYYSINMTAANNCDYSVKSNANWIKIAGSDVGSGSGSISFRVTVNPSISRTGTITVAGQTVTVTQSRN
ncbi:MAG TPA: S8 family serine peptidase, partial [Pyrinomonadaceae bacterium]|nr:S8 family serine peptidase [Pyrinomonadaceae bacterium]